MSVPHPIWLREEEVVEAMNLPDAIEALESGLRLQASGQTRNMSKTHVTWGQGSTLHAIGAVFEGAAVAGTKTWAHTERGATPLLILWNSETGRLLAVIEAFALGQMRTGAASGVATRWMAAADAEVLAILGAGKQALAQIAAVASVRRLKEVRVWSRDPAKAAALAKNAAELGYGMRVAVASSVAAATRDAQIVTLVTRAQEPFFSSAIAAPGAHINAVGAITPERQEFAQDLIPRVGLFAADDPAAARKLSREFGLAFGDDEAAWSRVAPLSHFAATRRPRPPQCDLSVFKAMGMGISDLALGIEVYLRATASGMGRPIENPRRVAPALGPRKAALEALA